MRKYNNKTKKTMIIIFVLFAVIIIIFSLFLKKSFDIEKAPWNDSGRMILLEEVLGSFFIFCIVAEGYSQID